MTGFFVSSSSSLREVFMTCVKLYFTHYIQTACVLTWSLAMCQTGTEKNIASLHVHMFMLVEQVYGEYWLFNHEGFVINRQDGESVRGLHHRQQPSKS